MLLPRGGGALTASTTAAATAAATAADAADALHGFLGRDFTHGGGDVKRRLVLLCGGALVVCQTRGGVFVLAVNNGSSSPGAGALPLKVWLRIRARKGISVVYQHPPPPQAARGPSAGGSSAGSSSAGGSLAGAALHEIPAGRMRVLAVAVSVGRVGTFHDILQSRHQQLMTAGMVHAM
jgi:hypothetical protein